MNNAQLEALHAPLLPILRHVLATAGLPRHGTVLDLASGPGAKLPLLADACGPAVTLLAIDHDQAAVAAAQQRLRAERLRGDALRGDAGALPLQDNSVSATCCIAALSLFADPAAALREMRRVTMRGGSVFVAGGVHQWAEVIHWPIELHEPLRRAFTGALAAGARPIPSPDNAPETMALFQSAGFSTPYLRAFLLHEPDTALAELSLLPWRTLRPLLAEHLDAKTLHACDAAAHEPEVELCALAFAAHSTLPDDT